MYRVDGQIAWADTWKEDADSLRWNKTITANEVYNNSCIREETGSNGGIYQKFPWLIVCRKVWNGNKNTTTTQGQRTSKRNLQVLPGFLSHPLLSVECLFISFACSRPFFDQKRNEM